MRYCQDGCLRRIVGICLPARYPAAGADISISLEDGASLLRAQTPIARCSLSRCRVPNGHPRAYESLSLSHEARIFAVGQNYPAIRAEIAKPTVSLRHPREGLPNILFAERVARSYLLHQPEGSSDHGPRLEVR